jgi:CRISPR-associated exonuclease Cas4
MTLVLLALLLFLLGSLLLRGGSRGRRETGIPDGEILYQDHSGQQIAPRALVSERYGISGKPDCLIRTPDGIVPVELKTSARPPRDGGVHPNHLLQVLAYCLFVEEHYGEPIPYGLVRYRGQPARKVFVTKQDRAWVLATIADVREARDGGEAVRSHRQPGRCRGCGMRDECNQSLAGQPSGTRQT